MPNIGALRDMIHRHDGESPQETEVPAGEGTTGPSTAPGWPPDDRPGTGESSPG